MAGFTKRPVSRRVALESLGVGILGLAGAALIGCGSSSGGGGAGSGGGAATQATVAPVTEATGVDILPLTAPVVKGTKKPGGIFKTALNGKTYTEHDSHTQRAASEWHVISEKLTEANFTDAKTIPHIASSWEAADPTTLIFKIQPGVKIHNVAPWNGREFDAEDVAWNLERLGGLYADRLKLPKAAFQRASMVANIQKAVATDKHTVKVTLSAPNSGFFAGVSENRTVMMPKEMDDIGYKDPTKMAGPGAYQITDMKNDQIITYKKFDQYFRKGEPSFDEFHQVVVPDSASQIAAIGTGQINLYRPPTNVEGEQVQKANPDILMYTWIDSNWHHIRPSMTFEPFHDIRVRKALHLVLDYARIGNQEEGTGWGFQAALSPGFQEAWKPEKVKSLAGYNPDTKEKDIAEGKKLMAAAGYPDGKGLEFKMLFASATGEPNAVAVIVQQEWTQAFPQMKVTLDPADNGTFSRRQALGDFQTLSYTITAVPDPVLEMISQYETNGSRNYGAFSDPDLDSMLDKGIKELDFNKRKELLNQFQQKWVDDWRPMYVMHANAARYLISPNVGGFDKTAGTFFGYSTYTKVGRWFYVDK
jgi:peptide/nickel transport system substrate-binding protein